MTDHKGRGTGRTRIAALLGATILACGTLTAAKAEDATQGYKAVTDERLANPEPENWLQYRGNYAGWGYSPLDKITAENVSRLVPAWTLSTGVMDGHQSPPIVNNGIMFISTPQAQVLAVDARDGTVLWRYQKDLPPELFQLHPTNRGVGLYGDKVYVATTDACVVALEAKTGKVAWTKCVANWKDGYYMTLSPLVAKGKVVVGVSGGEFGIRGFITALDSETGNEAWKNLHRRGSRGSGLPDLEGRFVEDRRRAGLDPGHLRPEDGTRLLRHRQRRPVDAGHPARRQPLLHVGAGPRHQQRQDQGPPPVPPQRRVDWDEVSAPVLIDIERNGKKVPAALHAGRDGYLWTLERTKDGPINFLEAKPFVEQDVFTGLDPKTGRPSYDMAKTPHTGQKASFCPSLWGGKDWPPEAYNPGTGLFYIPANTNLCADIQGVAVKNRKPGELYIGVPVEEILSSLRFKDGLDVSKPVRIGQLQAWDPNTGKQVWTHDFMDSATWGPVLTTGSGLVFAGGTSDRKFRAFDGKTGKVLWEMRLNSGTIGVPPPSRWTACSTWRCSPAGASMPTGCSGASTATCPRSAGCGSPRRAASCGSSR